jgi:predicted RNase H-like HicB family nuclease
MHPSTFKLIPDPQFGGFTAHLPGVSAYGEGETTAEAIADLEEAIQGYIETFGLDSNRGRMIDRIPKIQ